MDLGEWLRNLGLGEYEAVFRKNEIDEEVLPCLTADDLKELGVDIVGHRRKLLDAIAALRGHTEAKAPATDTAAPVERPAGDSAERRQVTVMFSDLVGSTALSARMDPEDLREVIATYRKCVTDIVRRFGGFVAKYMGDGVLVYFGYPQAHEDDAERAVRAGLDLVAAVPVLASPGGPVSLQTRVGIATGMVVVGDLIGSGEAQERGIVGETPNLAARLQAVAEPNMVVIAEGTRRLLGNLFELEDLATKDLKGIGGLVRSFAALRPSSAESRFEALHASGLIALVGREEECELLMRRWSRAKSGEGQVVLLSGEAGVGKSRLTAALLESAAAEPHTRLRYFCSPQYTDSTLDPVIRQMERAAGLAREDTPQAKLDKLDALLAQTSTSPQDAALFADMLSLPNDGRYPALELSPQQRRQRTLEALIAQNEVLTRKKPALMILEDAHWADPTTLELFSRAIDRLASRRVLLIVTFRPEFAPPWIGRPHVTALTINRLTRREADAMIDRIAGDERIPASIRQDIIERTDGIPLFVEEMTKAVLEAGSVGAAAQTAAAVPPPALGVPASLHASLMARLDRLGSAKEVAQVGAAIGREFPHALLAAVARKPEAELNAALDRLTQSGLLFRHGAPPHATYLFKHALVQDAAYGTLLREPRRTLHARIAESIESEFADIAERQPELLARHCTEAGLIEKAAALWGKAGQRSLARSALVEATAQLTRATDQFATLPGTPALRREQLKLQVALANALMHVRGYASSDAKAAVERARLFMARAEELGEPLEEPLLLFSVLNGVWAASHVAFDGETVRNLAVEILALAEQQGKALPRVFACRVMGMALLFTGDVADGRGYLDRALTLYDPAKHRPPEMVLCYRSLALWVLGYPDAALADADQALRDARESGQGTPLIFALAHVPLIYIQCGNYAAASVIVDELLALTDEKGSSFWKAFGMLLRGWLFAVSGQAVEAVEITNSGIDAWRATGATVLLPLYRSYLARAYAELRQPEEARRCIDEAMTAAETTKETWAAPDIHRIAGEIALLGPKPDAAKAQAFFERALAAARAQQAKSFELRAATSLARLLRDQGKSDAARDLLAPVHGWFTQGFGTFDLKEAKTLLDALAQ